MNICGQDLRQWSENRPALCQVEKYLKSGRDFIDESLILAKLDTCNGNDKKRISDIIDKSMSIQSLSLEETAYLLNVKDKDLILLMARAAAEIKKKVYDNRIVTFAPLYLSNLCVNNCLYCGFRSSNNRSKKVLLSLEQVKSEVKVLAGEIGHKRLVVVYGEHPDCGIDYMVDTIKAIYDVKVKTKNGFGNIRRVNVNAPPLRVEELARLREAGIGTYQVFQETYHRDTYNTVHPHGTIKNNYGWRLYTMHRAQEAGIDDVGIGVLFGLYDWRFEVMGLVAHSLALEEDFGIGPHTISFPRLEPADNTPFISALGHKVSDDDFKKLIIVLRLAVPYTGMIITARETRQMRRQALALGITQTDASTKIGIGAYSDNDACLDGKREQFILGDTGSLEEVIGEFASMGYISSFCTAGYRCGRTGKCIMELLRSGQEGKFCKLNAVLTFREWLDDFATEEVKKKSEPVIESEIKQIKEQMPDMFCEFIKLYERVKKGERDLYF
ncbi:MAG: [FeFe] hydrogenase H-cluster radical SAM maturase HydG [Candidatus Omnitrophica bacterium]|nr:[FeFe] hydrogenase H-cluster radical SAM maturase HydG [Candidatus Omnitrophota bacterium]